ncbi:hypothetical protein [Mycobacterium sp. EPa45]|uniref:hypothetical protein n=1 Tax=Mycobacterium sp. EPa45 TaxID=1545728 RepID=UPI000AAEA25A
MTDQRYELVVAPTVRRQLTQTLPEAVAFAAYEFITGPLLDNPHQVGRAIAAAARRSSQCPPGHLPRDLPH